MSTTVFRNVPGQYVEVNEPLGMNAEVNLRIDATLTPDQAFRLADLILDASRAALNVNIQAIAPNIF